MDLGLANYFEPQYGLDQAISYLGLLQEEDVALVVLVSNATT